MWDKPQLLNSLSNLMLGFAVVLLLYMAGFFVIARTDSFPIERIKIMGQPKNISPAQLEAVISGGVEGNFFTVDLEKTRNAFEQLPWVKSVNLRRRWPNEIQVTIQENEPIARWGDSALVASNGALFNAASNVNLPVFVGTPSNTKEMVEGYQVFAAIVAKEKLKITQLELNDRRAWRLVLDNGLIIQLGRGQVDQRLERFIETYDRTVKTIGKIQYVDLRYPNGFAVRTKDVKLPESVASAKAKQPPKKSAAQ